MSKVVPTDPEVPAAPGQATDTRDALTLLKVWDELEYSNQYFKHVRIANDGGFSDVPLLFSPSRFVWALLPILSLVLNMYFVLSPGLAIVVAQSFTTKDVEGMDDADSLLLTSLMSKLFCEENMRISINTSLAVLELSICVVYLCQLAFAIGKVAYGHKVFRWEGVSDIFWNLIPALSSFSAMNSLYFVCPKVLAPALKQQTARLRKHWRRNLVPFSVFLALRVFYAVVGVEAFVIKFCIASHNFRDAPTSFMRYVPALAFLNQLLGVFDVQKFAKKRLFTFVFGGEDSVMSLRELLVSRVWLAMLARHIWQRSKAHRFRVLWFLATALSYSDDDFQQLVIDRAGPDPQCLS
uniref:Uncharacterized protein n=1 Tax=Zooxanthella nutricula TaxID=1333877 RepID=A0A7S2JAJ0_9DINO